MADKDSTPKNPYDVELPQSVVESFARFLLLEICKFYDSEQGQKEFVVWQEQQKSDTR